METEETGLLVEELDLVIEELEEIIPDCDDCVEGGGGGCIGPTCGGWDGP